MARTVQISNSVIDMKRPRESKWWGRGDSNPHGLLHWILSPACLPVPALPHGRREESRIGDMILSHVPNPLLPNESTSGILPRYLLDYSRPTGISYYFSPLTLLSCILPTVSARSILVMVLLAMSRIVAGGASEPSLGAASLLPEYLVEVAP